jgi:hypothetical protein
MAAVLDFRTSESYIGQDVPISLTVPGEEVFLTSIRLNIPNVTRQIILWSTVGWQASTAFTTILFRIRRDNPTSGAIIFGTFDSQFVNNRTFSSVNTDLSKPFTDFGTKQTYNLTVQLSAGDATIIGPVSLTGFVMG